MGKKYAPIRQETTEMIITANPEEIWLKRGENLKIRLNPTEISITIATLLYLFAGGIIMAINIAYNAIERAEIMLSGRIFPDRLPRIVPRDQNI